MSTVSVCVGKNNYLPNLRAGEESLWLERQQHIVSESFVDRSLCSF